MIGKVLWHKYYLRIFLFWSVFPRGHFLTWDGICANWDSLGVSLQMGLEWWLGWGLKWEWRIPRGGGWGDYRWRQATSGNICNPTLFSFGHVMLPWCQPLTLNSQMHFSNAPTIFHPLHLLTYCSPCQQWSPRNLCMFKYVWCVLQDLIKVPLPSYQNSFKFLSSQRFLPPLNFWGNFCSQDIIYCCLYTLTGVPGGHSSKESVCSAWDVGSRCRFNPWVRKIPRRRKRQSTPVFLPGKCHGQRSLAGYSLWGHDLAAKPPSPPYTLIALLGICSHSSFKF